MDGKHTPGPWKREYDDEQEQWLIYGDCKSEPVPTEMQSFADSIEISVFVASVERESDAQLLEVAIDLLEACEEAIHYIDEVVDHQGYVRNQLAAAIAKATGETG